MPFVKEEEEIVSLGKRVRDRIAFLSMLTVRVVVLHGVHLKNSTPG